MSQVCGCVVRSKLTTDKPGVCACMSVSICVCMHVYVCVNVGRVVGFVPPNHAMDPNRDADATSSATTNENAGNNEETDNGATTGLPFVASVCLYLYFIYVYSSKCLDFFSVL